MTSVLICDDHRIVRESLACIVAEIPGVQRVSTAASGEEALVRFAGERPDLVLMDVHMPGIGGVEATRRLVDRHPTATVLVLTGEEDREHLASAIAAGARGYLLKDVSREELCAAVAAGLAGRDLVEPSLRRVLAGPVSRAGRSGPSLTQRELQVLQGMSQGKSNAEIGRALFLSEDTIKTHARRLFRKLGVADRAQAVANGFRLGLVC